MLPARCVLTGCAQEKSYFAVRLPHGWWLFGLDLALVDGESPLQAQHRQASRPGCVPLPPTPDALTQSVAVPPASQHERARACRPSCWPRPGPKISCVF